MKKQLLILIGHIVLGNASGSPWLGERLEALFSSVNVSTNGVEVSFHVNSVPYGISRNGNSEGPSTDFVKYLIRYGDHVRFYNRAHTLEFRPFSDAAVNIKRFRVLEDDASRLGGLVYRQEGTLVPDAKSNKGYVFINEVMYENDIVKCSYELLKCRNVESNVQYESFIDTNELRLLQYQDYRNTHRCTNNSSVPKLKYSEWLQEREVLDRNVGASNSASVGKKTELGRGYVWIILFGGVTLLLLGFGVFFVKKRQM